jgi:eukaryotic-like serine/threonine-protein kinase
MLAAEELFPATDERVQRALRRVGQVIRDRWHLDRVLGVGGMASVYAATHRNGKRVALKMLHPELCASPEERQRFVDEGYVANCVEHPGAVSVIDDDVTEDGHAFLIMDLLEGETLDQMVGEGGWLLPTRVLTIADAVLDILAAAHDKGIVHRDVKPDNIFVTRDGQVRLLDFGIARLIVPGRNRTTQMGTPLGTPAFMPPEQARGRLEQLDGRTDLWALGATMFFLLTGRDVHQAETVAEELLAAMTKPAPSLGEVAPHLPEPLIELVDRALAFERTERWPDAREMQAAVRRVEGLLASRPFAPISHKRQAVVLAAPTLVTPSLAPVISTETSRRSRPFRAIAVIAVSAVASFAALIAARQMGRNIRSPAAPVSEIAVEAVPWDSPVASQDSREPDIDLAATESAASASALTTASQPRSPEKGSAARPKPSAPPVEEARTWVASGVRPPPTPLSAERFRAPAPMDPLDRRK